MSVENDRDGDRRRNSDHPTGTDTANPQSRTIKPRTPGNRGVGTALRTVYERTLKEDIPPEMLDLLGKLD